MEKGGFRMIVKCAIAIAAYFASVVVFFFIANIVCNLADLDTDMLVILSFIWPVTIVVVVFMLVFYMIENASDHVANKIYNAMYERKRRKEEKENK